MQQDSYLLNLLRYVEANPLRARLVEQAQQWPWSSLGWRDQLSKTLLDRWPVQRPRNWAALVNQPLAPARQQRIQASLDRGRPLGDDAWTQAMARQMNLQYTLNPRGRPAKSEEKG